MAQNNDSPGKRLKREEAKNTLYVSRPDDPRLQAYQDSLALHDKYLKKIQGLNLKKYEKLPYFNITNEEVVLGKKGNKTIVDVKSGLGNVDKIKPINYLSVKPEYSSNIDYGKINKKGQIVYESDPLIEVYKKPIRPVVFRPEELTEPLQPRQAPSPILTREEIIAPVPRPVDVPPAPPMKEPVMEEEAIVTERPVARKPPKAVMPRRHGGWSNQPLLMKLFPKLYER